MPSKGAWCEGARASASSAGAFAPSPSSESSSGIASAFTPSYSKCPNPEMQSRGAGRFRWIIQAAMNPDLIRRLPKTDLHVHLDGSLRLPSLIEMARERKVALPSQTEDGLREPVFRPRYRNLQEYLEGFRYTVAVLQDAESLERAAFELCEDCQARGRALHRGPLRAAAARARRVRGATTWCARWTAASAARPTPSTRGRRSRTAASRASPPASSCARCASSPREFSPGYRRFFEALPEAPVARGLRGRQHRGGARRRAAQARATACWWSGSTSPARSTAIRPRTTAAATRSRTRPSWARPSTRARTTVRSPSSRPSATCTPTASATARGCSTRRKIRDPRIPDRKAYVERLAQFIADKRITIEVCLTSNQQTVPELAGDLRRHPFGQMRKRRLCTTFCTDNRLVSNTTVSTEIARAVEAFGLTEREVRDCLIYGFKRSFFPGTYLEKRTYVRQVIDYADRVLSGSVHAAREA